MSRMDQILCGALCLATLTMVLTPLWFIGMGVYNILFGDPAGWFFVPMGFLLGGAVALLAMTVRESRAGKG